MNIKDIIFCKHYMNKRMEGKVRKDVPKTMKIINSVFPYPLKVILDIGANVGIYSLLFSFMNPDAVIYSFEPVRSTFDILEQNIKANNVGNIFPYNFGFYIDDTDITLGIPINRESKNVGLYTYKCKDLIKNTVLCKMKNLYQWICENNIKEIDLVKIDVEGSEYDIFKSSEEVLKNIKFIHIEMNESFGECNLIKELLKKHNFYYLETSRKSNQIWANSLFL